MGNNSDFSDRTDSLAALLKIRIAELTDRLGLSRDSLMGYRTGRYTVSEKAWRKLEAAEAAAGIRTVIKTNPAIESPPGLLAQRLRVQAAELLAMAEQLEKSEAAELLGMTKKWVLPQSPNYTPATDAEIAEGKAYLEEIERKVYASDDLPEIKGPVMRRRA